MVKSNIWDVIIIGGGPAGCSAAMVLARSKRRVLLIDEGNQRNLRSHGIHNFLTRDGILPNDFLAYVHSDLAQYDLDIKKERVNNVKVLADKGFEVKTNSDGTYLSRRLLLATGVTDNIPNIPGMKELWGNGVYHCPFCDGYECADKTIGLYAKNMNGYGMSLALKHLSETVTLYTDGAHYLKAAQRQQLAARNVTVISKRVKELSMQNGRLKGVALEHGDIMACDSMFVLHGNRTNDQLLTQLGCKLTSKGCAVANRKQQTNIPGVYVAGDAAVDMHFVAVAAAEGLKAGASIHSDLLQTDN